MTWSDWFDLLVFGIVVYAITPRIIRQAIAEGAGPLIGLVAGSIRQALVLLERVAFRVVVGEWREPVTSTPAPEPPPDPPIGAAIAPPLRSPANVIAMPRNDDNPPVADCAHCATLAGITGDDPRQVQAAVIALARLHMGAKTADGKPKVGETDAIRYGMGIAPSSSSAAYQAARQALKAEISRQRGDPPSADPIVEATGPVVREAPDGSRYVIADDRSRRPA